MSERTKARWRRPSRRPRCVCMGARALFPLFLATVLSMALVHSVSAQNVPTSGVRASFSADRSELTVGDVVTLSLVIAHPANLVVVLPRLERVWGPFEVQDQTSVQTISVNDGTRTIAKQFRVTLFATGDFETPALPITVRGPYGSVEEIEPVPVQLTVRSVLSGPDDQLKDLRPPADFSTPLWRQPAVVIVAILAVLGTLGAVTYFLYRRSRRDDTTAELAVDTRSPWEVAIEEFERIERIDRPGNGDLKGHYTLVAGALRTWLGATFLRGDEFADAADMSTEEIGMAVRQLPLDGGNTRTILELLQEADLVKFANYAPTQSRAYEAAGQARALIETMRVSSQQRAEVAAAAGGNGAP